MPTREPETSTPAGDGVRDRTTFASTLREALRHRGLTLRRVRETLLDRGHDISVSTLSMWQSGARRPERDASLDVIRELELILRLDDDQLFDALGPSRRVGPDRHEPYAAIEQLPRNGFTAEPAAELYERSGSIGVHVDADGRIGTVVNRTLWQARRDGAQHATVFFGLGASARTPPDVRGTLGCELIDIRTDLDQSLLRATLRLHSSLNQGELALTERRSTGRDSSTTEHGFGLVAPRRQSEVVLYVNFDASRLPRRCRVTVESAGETTSHSVALNGTCATHAEFNFGPGRVTMEWDW